RRMLFPEATDKEFADGYAQTVTFGLLIARARGIALAGELDKVLWNKSTQNKGSTPTLFSGLGCLVTKYLSQLRRQLFEDLPIFRLVAPGGEIQAGRFVIDLHDDGPTFNPHVPRTTLSRGNDFVGRFFEVAVQVVEQRV
ncbi:MAG: hypothetical protein AAF266_16330, partial [Planctomycetota bacterium]